jgi:hypothetical protein
MIHAKRLIGDTLIALMVLFHLFLNDVERDSIPAVPSQQNTHVGPQHLDRWCLDA